MSRGEVWLTAFDPVEGHEIRKTRPALVLSPDHLNESLGTVIVAPMTTGSAAARFRVPVELERKRGLILIDQLRAVDRVRLVRHAGRVSGKTLAAALRCAQEMFAE